MILDKALTLDLEHFEDSEFYDRLTRARREASQRPLSLVMRSFTLVQNLVSLVSFSVLLFTFSPWAVLLLVVAGLPGFVAETKFSNDAFRLFRWRSSERRMQAYLETVIAREDHAKEVKLYALGQAAAGSLQVTFTRSCLRRSASLSSAATAGVSHWDCWRLPRCTAATAGWQ